MKGLLAGARAAPGKRIPGSAVPMSLLADHPNVHFHYYRGGPGSCAVEMH